MENKYNSYKLTEFDLIDQINLGLKCGLLKMLRTEDGTLVLEPISKMTRSPDTLKGLVSALLCISQMNNGI